MTCATCSAATLAPLVEGGVSVWKICDRARRALEDAEISIEGKAAIHELMAVATLLAADNARKELLHDPG